MVEKGLFDLKRFKILNGGRISSCVCIQVKRSVRGQVIKWVNE